MSVEGESRRGTLKLSLMPLTDREYPILFSLGPYSSTSGEYVRLSTEQAVEVASWLLGIAALVKAGNGEKIAETLTLKFADLARALTPQATIADDDPLHNCPVCERVIPNWANMQRHLLGHGWIASRIERWVADARSTQ